MIRFVSQNSNQKPHGFTLIELVLSLALVGVLGAVITYGLPAAVQSYDLIWARRAVLTESRSGMARMTKEIRLIPSSSQIISIGAANFQFEYPAATTITYSLSGGNLFRNSDILIKNISTLTFSYYDETGSTTSTPANVREIGIAFTADSPGNISSYSLKTRVFLRNTGNDYANYTSP